MTIEKPKSENTEFDDVCRELLVEARDHGCANSLNLLAVRLTVVTRRVAMRVVLGGWQAKEHFADESLALVFAPYLIHERNVEKTVERSPRIFRFDPERYVYEPWCRKVLRNLWVSKNRKLSPERTVAAFPSVKDTTPLDYLRLGKPFSGDDLSVISSWPAGERLMLLCLSGLFVKLDQSDWKEFIDDAEAVFGFSLPVPFPIYPLLEAEDPSSRMTLVADIFRIKINTLSARWMRKKYLLRELSIIRDCEPESELDN